MGEEGNDTLVGGSGADTLTGGSGRDTFVFAPGSSGQTRNFDVIADYTKGAVGTGDLIDFSAALTVGGSSAAASSTQASINPSTAVASFASGSGTTLDDALSDIATRFTAAIDAAGEFALFRVNQTGNFYVFISDGSKGVTANDVVIQLTGITSVATIDLTGGNLTLIA
jgi:Ca2+-binding RTX toxin-like protein